MFIRKLNKKEKGYYSIVEEVKLTNGQYEALLNHSFVNRDSIIVQSADGTNINNFTLRTHVDKSWRTIIRIVHDTPSAKILYETQGDIVDADDINNLQNANTLINDKVNDITTNIDKKADITYVDGKLKDKADKSEMKTALDGKVDKILGKGLSTNDFTNSEKSKLQGIEKGANKTDKLSQLENDTKFITIEDVPDVDLSDINKDISDIKSKDKQQDELMAKKADKTELPKKLSDLTDDTLSKPVKYSERVKITDTRNVDDTPLEIMKSGASSLMFDFKLRKNVGSPDVDISANNSYAHILTVYGWTDSTGGYPTQISFGKEKVGIRTGTSNDAWSSWRKHSDDSAIMNDIKEMLKDKMDKTATGDDIKFSKSESKTISTYVNELKTKLEKDIADANIKVNKNITDISNLQSQKANKTDLDPINKEITDLKKNKANASDVETSINNLKKMIEDIDIPEVDLQPILDSIAELENKKADKTFVESEVTRLEEMIREIIAGEDSKYVIPRDTSSPIQNEMFYKQSMGNPPISNWRYATGSSGGWEVVTQNHLKATRTGYYSSFQTMITGADGQVSVKFVKESQTMGHLLNILRDGRRVVNITETRGDREYIFDVEVGDRMTIMSAFTGDVFLEYIGEPEDYRLYVYKNGKQERIANAEMVNKKLTNYTLKDEMESVTGDVEDLTTTDKSNLVSAINEVNAKEVNTSDIEKDIRDLKSGKVDKNGDTMTGTLKVTTSSFPTLHVDRNTTAQGNRYGAINLSRTGTNNPVDGIGIGMYFKNNNSNAAETHSGFFGGALDSVTSGSEIGQLVFAPAWRGQDPYSRTDFTITAISDSKSKANLRGKLTTDETVAGDSKDTVATKGYVDTKSNTSAIESDIASVKAALSKPITWGQLKGGVL